MPLGVIADFVTAHFHTPTPKLYTQSFLIIIMLIILNHVYSRRVSICAEFVKDQCASKDGKGREGGR